MWHSRSFERQVGLGMMKLGKYWYLHYIRSWHEYSLVLACRNIIIIPCAFFCKYSLNVAYEIVLVLVPGICISSD